MIAYSVKSQNFIAAANWCVEMFGEAKLDRWYTDSQPFFDTEFIFQREEDATLFALRWL